MIMRTRKNPNAHKVEISTPFKFIRCDNILYIVLNWHRDKGKNLNFSFNINSEH